MLTVRLRNIDRKYNLRTFCSNAMRKDSEYENILKIGQTGVKIKRKNQFTAERGRFRKLENYLFLILHRIV